MNNEKASALRREFPVLQGSTTYLDSAATTQKPITVIDTVNKFYREENATVHRGLYKISEEATLRYDSAHEVVGNFINASAEEVIFTRNTTDAINTIARIVENNLEGNEIVLTEMEHHANLVPWQQLAKRKNLKLKFIPVKDDFTLDYDKASEIINSNTCLVAMSHVSNALGTINDVEKLISLAKENGAITVIDAAQSVPHKKIDVRKINCDFLAFSGHKMLAPMGIGVFYGRKELLEKFEPVNFGGDMISSVTFEDATWDSLPGKFEAGTPNVEGAIGLVEAIKYLESLGMDQIEAWEKELLKYALEKIGEIDGIEVYTAGVENSCGILSFNFKNIHPHDVAQILADEGIAVRAGHHCAMPLLEKFKLPGTVRASFYLYNTYSDVDNLINGLKKVVEVMK